MHEPLQLAEKFLTFLSKNTECMPRLYGAPPRPLNTLVTRSMVFEARIHHKADSILETPIEQFLHAKIPKAASS